MTFLWLLIYFYLNISIILFNKFGNMLLEVNNQERIPAGILARKKTKIAKKKEELPSFLLNLKNNPENVKTLLKPEKNVPHVGPIFFGCRQYHPQPHSLDLSGFHHTQYTASSKENLLSGMFLPKSTGEKIHEIRKPFRPVMKFRRKVFTDLHPHKCPGTLKVFKPETIPFVIDFGETVSIIKTEISREIPFPCWIKQASSDSLEAGFELVTLSDLWERERKKNVMTSKERMAHTHFPKEFATLRVIGPPIPEAITITQLPSKRKTYSEIDLHLLSKSTEKDEGKEEEEKVLLQFEETSEGSNYSVEEEISMIEKVELSDKKEEESVDVTEEDNFERDSEENLSDTSEVNIEKKQKSVTFEDKEEEDEENSEEEQGVKPNIQEEEGEENPIEEVPEE